jgi:FtsX-like permease family
VIRDGALGVRLAGVGGRGGLVRMMLMATGSAAAVVVVLTSFGLTRVVDRQDTRAQHIAANLATNGGGFNATFIADSWDGREMRRVVLASDLDDVPTPPGLERLPRNGEVMMSPALENLAASERLIDDRFPQPRGPHIEPDGLIAPDQLLAYIGASTDQLGPYSSHIESFGNPSASSRLDPRAARTIALLITLLLIAPVVMFMAVCARLSANSRTQRLAALRLLGLTRRRTQLVNATEIGITAAAGSVIGWLLWTAWITLQPEVHIGVFAWYSTDIKLSPFQQIATIAGLVVLSVTVAVVASRDAIANPSRTRRDRSSRQVSLWRLAPLTVGGVALVIARMRAGGSSGDFRAWVPLFGLGLTLTAIGLVLAAPIAATIVGRFMMRSSRPSWLLAGSRLRHDPAATSRVVAALAVALFAAGIAQIVAASLDEYDAQITSTIPPVVNLEIIGPPTNSATYQPISPLTDPLPNFRIGPPGHELDAVAATCTQLRTATGQPLPNCADGQVQRVISTEPNYTQADDAPSQDDINAALAYAQLPATAGAPLDLTIPFVDGFFTPAIVVPPDLAPNNSSRFYIPIPSDQYDPQTLTTVLAARSPTAFWNPFITGIDRLDTPRIYRGIIAAGTIAALVIGAAALTVATIANAIEHRSRLRALAAIGANPDSIRLSVILETAPVSLGLLVIASTAAIAGGNAYLQFSYPGAAIPLRALGALIGFSFAATALASVLAAGAVTRLNRDEIIRQE